METWEKELRLHNLQKSIDVDLNFDTPVEIVKAEFSTEQREKLADKKEALPDGSYPIRNASDLKNAIQAYGRAKDKAKAKAWIKRRAKELGKEGSLPEEWNTEAKVEKALEDELEKAGPNIITGYAGKRAQIGEVRNWHGVSMKKVSNTGNSHTDWQPVKQSEQKTGKEKPAGQEEGQLSEDELKEHAKNASEQALSNAIKTSPDPTVRQVAHAEMKRRQTEEKSGAGDSFPGKPSGEGEKKEGKKEWTDTKTYKRDIAGTDKFENPELYEKEQKKLHGKHKEEIANFIKRVDKNDAELDKVPAKERTQEHYDKHHKEFHKLAKEQKNIVERHHQEMVALHEKHSGKKIEKSVQGIRYF